MAQLIIGENTHQMLLELAHQEGIPVQVVLVKAVAEYRKKRFFDSLNAAFVALKNEPKAWAEEQQERQAWALTLLDGADPDESWTENGNVVASG